MKKNLPISQREIRVASNANILSTTDPQGRIRYINQDFVDISGFTEEDLLGQDHNIVRHPDMPPEAFKQMWHTLKQGRSWMGLVKNRCKNGDHYWISAYVTPVMHKGQVVEFQSVRTVASQERIARATPLYQQLLTGQAPKPLNPPALSFCARLNLMLSALALFAAGLLAVTHTLPWVIAAALACGLSAALTTITAVALTPLKKLAKQARQVTNNPLSQWVYTGQRDEFGQIAFALHSSQAEAGAVIGRLAESARELSHEAIELASAVDSSNLANLEQQTQAEHVASAIGQMACSVQEVARHAQLSASAANEADLETANGLQLVEQTRQLIADLAVQVQQSHNVIHQLNLHSQDIHQVIEVIQGIAEQTNLLALNAAIEAARAGEAGRGFAVVADEVRGLAQRTQQSTAKIHSIINALQQGTGEAVATMQLSQSQAAVSVKQALEATTALDGINQRVAQISDMSIQIAAAVEQQSVVGDDIQNNLSAIRQANLNSVSASHQSRNNAQHLALLAARLELLVAQFQGQKRYA